MADQQFNQAKFDELVLYIVSRVEEPSNLGAVKLHKVLWFSDLTFFAAHGRSIAGDSYIKMPQGPFSTHAEQAIGELTKAERMIESRVRFFSKSKRHFFSKAKNNPTLMSADEISVVDRMIEVICLGHTATSISNLSHTRIWEITPDRAEIPIETVFSMNLVEPNELTENWADSALTAEVLNQANSLMNFEAVDR